jgi:hypothetical protein
VGGVRASRLLVAGIMLFYLGIFFSSAATACSGVPDMSDVPPAVAEEAGGLDKHPMNAPLLTKLVLATTSFGASVLSLLATNAIGWGAMRHWRVEAERPWLAATHRRPSFLRVFLL